MYLEAVCPLFLALAPPKQGLFQSEQPGNLGSRYTHSILNTKHLLPDTKKYITNSYPLIPPPRQSKPKKHACPTTCPYQNLAAHVDRVCGVIYIWMFPFKLVPQNEWFIMENPIKMDDLGELVPLFLETSIYERLSSWCEPPPNQLHPFARKNS